jgi:type II secretory pathway component PulF
MSEPVKLEPLIALSCFARQFSMLLNAGVSLIRSLEVLETTTSNPQLVEMIADLRTRVGAGDILSKAMSGHRDWFSGVALSMVRAGEIGGVMDETMEAWADMLDRDLQLREKLQLFRLWARLAEAVGGPSVAAWQSRIEQVLAGTQPTVAASIFCWNLGTMLQSGVPIIQSLEVAAEILDEAAREQARRATEAVRKESSIAQALQQVAGLGDLALQLICIGEETGTLDTMCQRAGELLRRGAERDVEAAMELCPG